MIAFLILWARGAAAAGGNPWPAGSEIEPRQDTLPGGLRPSPCPRTGVWSGPRAEWCPTASPGEGPISAGCTMTKGPRSRWGSQNPSMVGAGRDLCGSPSPTPCPSRVTHSRLHSTASRRGWNISREGDSTTSLGSFLCAPSLSPAHKHFFLSFFALNFSQIIALTPLVSIPVPFWGLLAGD